jgi:hypothetical protein
VTDNAPDAGTRGAADAGTKGLSINRPEDPDVQALTGAGFVYLATSSSQELAYYAARVFWNRAKRKQRCQVNQFNWGKNIAEVIRHFGGSPQKSPRWALVMAPDGTMLSASALAKLAKAEQRKLDAAIAGATTATDDKVAGTRKFAKDVYDVAPTGMGQPGDMEQLLELEGYEFFGYRDCAAELPSDSDEALLAAVIFAEATQGRTVDDERRLIAWCVINRLRHLDKNEKDVRYFGEKSMIGVLSKQDAFKSYQKDQWNKITVGDQLRKEGRIECLTGVECTALQHALAVARELFPRTGDDEKAPTHALQRVIGFNQALNTPPSPRMRKLAVTLEKEPVRGPHTFYEFIPGREDG